jgi:hypothetical protein
MSFLPMAEVIAISLHNRNRGWTASDHTSLFLLWAVIAAIHASKIGHQEKESHGPIAKSTRAAAGLVFSPRAPRPGAAESR